MTPNIYLLPAGTNLSTIQLSANQYGRWRVYRNEFLFIPKDATSLIEFSRSLNIAIPLPINEKTWQDMLQNAELKDFAAGGQVADDGRALRTGDAVGAVPTARPDTRTLPYSKTGTDTQPGMPGGRSVADNQVAGDAHASPTPHVKVA